MKNMAGAELSKLNQLFYFKLKSNCTEGSFLHLLFTNLLLVTTNMNCSNFF